MSLSKDRSRAYCVRSSVHLAMARQWKVKLLKKPKSHLIFVAISILLNVVAILNSSSSFTGYIWHQLRLKKKIARRSLYVYTNEGSTIEDITNKEKALLVYNCDTTDRRCSGMNIQSTFIYATPNAIELEDIPNEVVCGTMQHETAEGNIQPDVSSQEYAPTNEVNDDEGYCTKPHEMLEEQCEECTISVDVGGDDDQDMPTTIKALVVSCSRNICCTN
ncbi:hypothetical protein EMCRGX_G012844 [Ephydatia muelleri]